MKHPFYLVRLAGLLLFFSMVRPLQSQQILKAPMSPRITNYQIRAALDPEKKTVNGEMAVEWRNPSRDTVRDLQFHLYLNAFKNMRSKFMGSRPTRLSDEDDWGFTDITEMMTSQGENLLDGIEFIQPDVAGPVQNLGLPDEKPLPPDVYDKDQTVARIKLDQPVLPDSTIRLNIRFTSKLPKITARTGFSQDYFFVAQWFPKLGVYEPAGMRYAEKGGWNTHQFHPSSEFYANHSLYEVEITLPEGYEVGTGGKLTGQKSAGRMQTLSYRAEDIVDFAWTASRNYRIVEDQWKHVAIRLMM
jgi:hypothetical protein